MELENCSQPAIVTKDLSMLIYARDSKISAASRFCRSLIGGISKSPGPPLLQASLLQWNQCFFLRAEMNRVPGVYLLTMMQESENSPG
jgi:kinesin family protein 1